jgi:hypothetical protein
MKTKFSASINLSKLLLLLIFFSSCLKSTLPKIKDLKADTSTSTKNNKVDAICLSPLYRYWNNSIKDHFYTVTQGSYPGWAYEQIECTVNTCQQGDWKPFYRYWNNSGKDHYYTTVLGTYPGWSYEGIECYVLLTQPPSPTTVKPLYRYWNYDVKDHFYTVTLGNYSGYVYEGIACYVLP